MNGSGGMSFATCQEWTAERGATWTPPLDQSKVDQFHHFAKPGFKMVHCGLLENLSNCSFHSCIHLVDFMGAVYTSCWHVVVCTDSFQCFKINQNVCNDTILADAAVVWSYSKEPCAQNLPDCKNIHLVLEYANYNVIFIHFSASSTFLVPRDKILERNEYQTRKKKKITI